MPDFAVPICATVGTAVALDVGIDPVRIVLCAAVSMAFLFGFDAGGDAIEA